MTNDQILYTTQSIGTRLKWITDLQESELPQDFNCVDSWEAIVHNIYFDLINRDKIIELVLQCRVVGLTRLANDIENALGETTENERVAMYQLNK